MSTTQEARPGTGDTEYPRLANAAVERREARRPASLAGDLRRTADRPSREAGHRVRRSAPAPVGALPPSLTCKGKRREKPGRKK